VGGSSVHGNTKGFTLIEALIGLFLLAFGLMAVVTMMDWSFNASTLSKTTTKATHLASWMMDRIKQDTSLVTQVYSTNIASLRSFDNDATTNVVVDTSSAVDPALEPGRTAVREWRALLQGLAVGAPVFLGQDTLPGDRLPQARGIVTITPYDPTRAGNHRVVVQVTWQGVLTRGVRLESVLATAE
jgi:type IV pilus modification protein PilV